MKTKQLEIFKVIEFPKNREMEIKQMDEECNLRNKKLEVAKAMLEILTEEKADYHIIIKKEDVLKIFENNKGCNEYLMITSNFDTAKRIKIGSKNSSVYEIKSEELD